MATGTPGRLSGLGTTAKNDSTAASSTSDKVVIQQHIKDRNEVEATSSYA